MKKLLSLLLSLLLMLTMLTACGDDVKEEDDDDRDRRPSRTTSDDADEDDDSDDDDGGFWDDLLHSTDPEMVGPSVTVSTGDSLAVALGDADTFLGHKSPSAWNDTLAVDHSYGLDRITFSPARLNVTQGVVNLEHPLRYPLYGADGRVTELADDTLLGTYQSDAGAFVHSTDVSSVGVSAIGISDGNHSDNTTHLTDTFGFVINLLFRADVDGNLCWNADDDHLTIADNANDFEEWNTAIINAIRIVFMDSLGTILGIAAPIGDGTESDDAYSIGLALYEYSFDDEGVLTLGDPSDAPLATLAGGEKAALSALIFLDGDKTENNSPTIHNSSITSDFTLPFTTTPTKTVTCHITANTDHSYHVILRNTANSVVFEQDNIPTAPIKENVTEDVVSLSWATGMGPNDFATIFWSTKSGAVSPLFTAPRGYDGTRIAYGSADQTKIIVRDIFSDSYYAEYPLEGAYIGGGDIIIGGKLQDDKKAVIITYCVNTSEKTKTISIPLYE